MTGSGSWASWRRFFAGLVWVSSTCGATVRAQACEPAPAGPSALQHDSRPAGGGDEQESPSNDDPIVRIEDEKLPAPAKLPDVVARVNGTPISRAMLQELVVQRFDGQMNLRKTLLYTMALRRSLEKRSIKITDAEIDAEIATILKRTGKTLEELIGDRRCDEDYLSKQVYYRVGIGKLARAVELSQSATDISAVANARADLLLFKDNAIRWRWQGLPDTAWVSVNGEEIPLETAYRWAITWLSLYDIKKMLNELVVAELERQEIRNLKIEVPTARIEQMIEQQMAAGEKLEQSPEQQAHFTGVSLDTTQDRYWRFVGVEEILKRGVTDESLAGFAQSKGMQGEYGPKYSYSDIEIEVRGKGAAGTLPTPDDWKAAEEKIREAQRLLKDGKRFEDVAEIYCTDPDLRRKRGDRQWVLLSGERSIIDQEAEKLTVNQVSEPFKTGSAVHLIRLNGRQEGIKPAELLKDPSRRERLLGQYLREERKAWRLKLKRAEKTKLELFI